MPGHAPGKLSTARAKTRGEYHFDHSGGRDWLSPAANASPARYSHIEQCRAAMSGTPMRYQTIPHAPRVADKVVRASGRPPLGGHIAARLSAYSGDGVRVQSAVDTATVGTARGRADPG